MKNTNDIMQQLQQSQHEHAMRNYSGRIKEATHALQQAIQAINQIIDDITREGTFVEQIHNQMTVDSFMSTMMSTIHTVLQDCADRLDFTCPSDLHLLAAKQKALQGIYQSITDIQKLLARHSELYGIYNYEENYRIYQILHAFFKQIENDCLTLATYNTEADVIAWLETHPATHRQFITALQEIGQSFIDKYAARDVIPMASTTTATPLTTSTSQVPTAESTTVEPQSVLAGDTLSATTAIANLLSTADPALNTGVDFLTALPEELWIEIVERLDAKSLWALAATGKTQTERLFILIERELKNSTVQITAKASQTFLFTPHQLLGRGRNDWGQLGLSHINRVDQFTPIPGLTGQILQVIAKRKHTFVLTTEGLFGCGGPLGLGLAGRIDRARSLTLIPKLPGKILQIIAGGEHFLVLTTEGLFGCGSNYSGQLGLGRTNRATQFTQVTQLPEQILQVIAGYEHTLVLTTEGLFGSGDNTHGQLGLGHTNEVTQFTPIPGLTGQILQVIAGGFHTLVLTTEGLFGCGNNKSGQLGLGHTDNVSQFTPIPGLMGQILQVIAGGFHTLVLTTEGLFGCGNNQSGQLGLGHTNRATQFTQVTQLPEQILQVIAGYDHTLVLTRKGLFGCGKNEYGQLGPSMVEQILYFTFIPDKNIKALLSLQRKWHLLQTIAKDALPQVYLLPANATESIASQKQAALAQLQIVIAGIKSLPSLYDLFVQVTQAKTSVLRLHRKNLLAPYGDTDSYRLAIRALAEKAMFLQSACNSFIQYTLLQTMLQEALRCNAPGQSWKKWLIKLKPAALKQLLQDIQQATDLNQLLELFQALIEPKNLLRFNASAIFHDYGDTTDYKTALLQLGKQMVNHTFTKQALPQLYLLREHLRIVKPRFNVEWQYTIEKLENKLHAVHKTICVTQAAAVPSARAAKP